MPKVAPPGLWLLLAGGPAAFAWGPLSHALVNQRALALLPGSGPAAWLHEEAAADAFVRAGPAADLTFRITAGGKTDPALNALLHAPGFAAFLLARAGARGPQARATALGILGHQLGDRSGNVPGSPTALDLFGFPAHLDPWGRPVADPARGAAAELFPVTAGINKILLDALARPALSRRRAEPDLDVALLADALAAYRGPDALAVPPEPGRAARRFVEDELRGFKASVLALRTLGLRIRSNRSLRAELAALYRGQGADLPGIEASARAVAAGVLAALGAGAPASATAPPAPGPEPGPAPGRGPDDAALAEALEASARPGPGPGPAATPAPGDLPTLRKRLLLTFFSRVVLPGARWPGLREAVRDQVPACSTAPAPAAPPARGAPGFDGLAGGP